MPSGLRLPDGAVSRGRLVATFGYTLNSMSGFFSNLLQSLQGHRKDMRFLCHRLLSERGEASQTAIAHEIITVYRSMRPEDRPGFFEILSREFSPDESAVRRAAVEYERAPSAHALAALSAAVEPPRQELIRRINTAPGGTETLVTMRGHLLALRSDGANFEPLDSDLRHLFRSWFNRGFLRLERISVQTSAAILEKLIRYESVHEINGWPDLLRRIQADRRCFAFFHPALGDEPIIFVEVALAKGLTGDLGPLLDVNAPVLRAERADTAIFYSINNCLQGLRNVPFGNFLIKQVVTELAAEFPNIKTYATLSPLPLFSKALRDSQNADGFTRDRLSRLLAEYSRSLTAAAGRRDPVDALFKLLERPFSHRGVLAEPLRRLALAYLTRVRRDGKLYDPVATFHLANGARLERINSFGNLRPYGLSASFGVTVNYRYMPAELEENHERFVRSGQIRVPSSLFHEHKAVAAAWEPGPPKSQHNKAR
ncbi:MAG TPA: malonyl-CoA decarboxylase family protein [Candidatus Acidoferrum sp.]|nr:malonyl-CoA decarboxylase family protein [Candidatus Acidoferrum sp.]